MAFAPGELLDLNNNNLTSLAITTILIIFIFNLPGPLVSYLIFPIFGLKQDGSDFTASIHRVVEQLKAEKKAKSVMRGIHGLQDEIRIESSGTAEIITRGGNNGSQSNDRYLIFMISGNPGLIEYYREFFDELEGLLRGDVATERPRFDFTIYGRSLTGFELEDKPNNASGPLTLPAQIDAVERSLLNIITRNEVNASPRKVILMGHSVGAYIAMEILSRHRARLEQRDTKHDPDSSEKDALSQAHANLDIKGLIGLFPTVIDIAKSPSGKSLSRLSRIPFYHNIVAFVARLLPTLLSYNLLRRLVGFVTKFPAHAVDVTTQFLGSRSGVRSALYLGRSEMQLITADRWSDEVWGAAHPSKTGMERAKMFFLFGEQDHWVADVTRDGMMRLRGRGDGGDAWRPHMEIDRTGIPHGFCIEHWKPVAAKCKEYIAEIMGTN